MLQSQQPIHVAPLHQTRDADELKIAVRFLAKQRNARRIAGEFESAAALRIIERSQGLLAATSRTS